MSDLLTEARARLAGFEAVRLIAHGPQDDDTYLLCLDDEADTDVARVWGTDPTCGLALARLLGNAPTDLRAALAEVDRLTARLTAEQDKRRAADAVLAEIGGWCVTHGAALKPGGGDADTFGDGMRAAKEQIRRVLFRNLNPNAGESRG